MYAKQAIIANNRKKIYAKSGDLVSVISRASDPVWLCECNGERFMTSGDNLQDEPLELEQCKTPAQTAERLLRTELRKLLNKDAYVYQITVNRVHYGKVSKFPKDITAGTWLRVAKEVWESNDKVALKELIDVNKANV